MKFIDEVIIEVEGGKGGDGIVAFRREKFVPFGGPSGGDGGKGGDVILLATSDLNTLYELGLQRFFKAEDGERGGPKNMQGAVGKDCIVQVPVGTLVYNYETGELLCDLAKHGDSFVVAKGGRGGRGNSSFASSVRRAPNFAEKGEPGEKLKIRLELKLLADVGIVGLPNAGKSTLLSVISNAKPKIADYPFTTLVPILGIVKPEGKPSFCVADMPGLIEDAHKGAGLGLQFLKHIERTKMLIHLIDIGTQTLQQAKQAFKTIIKELKFYNRMLLKKPMLVVASKLDLPQAQKNYKKFKLWVKKLGYTIIPISAATHKGLNRLINTVSEMLQQIKSSNQNNVNLLNDKPVVIRFLPPFEIEQIFPKYWLVKGREIEKLVAITDFTNDEAVMIFKKKVANLGFVDKIKQLQIPEEDTIAIGDMEFLAKEFYL